MRKIRSVNTFIQRLFPGQIARTRRFNKLVMVSFTVLAITACSATPGGVVGQPPQPGMISSSPVAPAERPGNDANLPFYTEYANGKLWLHLYSPQEGDVVDQQLIDVTGKAPVGTVISVNGKFILVADDENFSIPVDFEEGPNVIELIASNIDDEQIELVMTITYEP